MLKNRKKDVFCIRNVDRELGNTWKLKIRTGCKPAEAGPIRSLERPLYRDKFVAFVKGGMVANSLDSKDCFRVDKKDDPAPGGSYGIR